MNNSREKFEAWAKPYYKEQKMSLNSAEHFARPNEYIMTHYQSAYEGWQAATEQSQKEIAEKDARIAELEGEIDIGTGTCDLLSKELAEICLTLKGEPPYLKRFSYHDLPQLVKELQAREKVLVEVLERLSNDNKLWKVSGIGGQDYYAGKPPAIRIIDEALANVRGE